MFHKTNNLAIASITLEMKRNLIYDPTNSNQILPLHSEDAKIVQDVNSSKKYCNIILESEISSKYIYIDNQIYS